MYACGRLAVHRTCYIDISNLLLFILAASGLYSHWHTILHVPTIYISISFAELETFSGGFRLGGSRLFCVNLINFNFPMGGGGEKRLNPPTLPLPICAFIYHLCYGVRFVWRKTRWCFLNYWKSCEIAKCFSTRSNQM